MNRTIAVPLNDMNQIAMTWRQTVTEMDAVIQQVSRELSAIPDRAKGLNEVRAKGHQISAQHRQIAQDGLAVYQHVVDSAQRFAQVEQELTRMIQHNHTHVASTLAGLISGPIDFSGWVQKLPYAVDATHNDEYMTYALRSAKWLITLAKSGDIILKKGAEQASDILVYANIVRYIGKALEAASNQDVDGFSHNIAATLATAELAYILPAGPVGLAVGLVQASSWGAGVAQDKLRNTSGLEVYARTLEPIRQITNIHGVLTEVNKVVLVNRYRDLLWGGVDGFTNGIAKDWTNFVGIVENKANEMYRDRVEAREQTINLISNQSFVKEHFSKEQVEDAVNIYSRFSPLLFHTIPQIGIMNYVLGL